MKLKPFIILLFVALFTLGACRKKSEDLRSFCFWKTSLNFTATDAVFMNKIGVNHFYIRFFDVDWNPYEHNAFPIATVRSWWYGKMPLKKFTPSIYITNSVFENATHFQLDSLAQHIKTRTEMVLYKLSKDYAENMMYNYLADNNLSWSDSHEIQDSIVKVYNEHFVKMHNEILIDCDWTTKTKDRYFYFLKRIKKEFEDDEVSVTLRLWQYKYKDKAGIPPVDRCLLMCYSMESPKDYQISNSILTEKDISEYIKSGSYKLPLDVALPVFSWAVLFRGGKFKGLISKANVNNYFTDSVTFKPVNYNRFVIQTDTVLNDYYYRFGDEIRVEQMSPTELEKICRLVKEEVKAERITFFSWDTVYIEQYGIENLKKYYQILGN